MAEQKI